MLPPWGQDMGYYQEASWIQPSDYYSLLVVHIGSDAVDKKSTGIIKTGFKALGLIGWWDRSADGILLNSLSSKDGWSKEQENPCYQ